MSPILSPFQKEFFLYFYMEFFWHFFSVHFEQITLIYKDFKKVLLEFVTIICAICIDVYVLKICKLEMYLLVKDG